MCGICGFVGTESSDADAQVVMEMAETLRHRGPEGHGQACLRSQGSVLKGWFGHRRLKIIDLTEAARQPMSSDDGLVSLTYNGEIYNFRELRRELKAAGRSFRSSGDTEVVLRAYEHWGDDFVERIDGMFALAIWDGRGDGRLILARDRIGKKPLFWTQSGGRLTFGSEIKSLVMAPWVERRADLSRLPEYLTFGYVPHPRTFYVGIHQVPPASVLVFDTRGVHGPRTYWDPLERVHAAAPHGHELEGEIRRRLRTATERRMIADVPLGVLLSGGVDSSIVAALMSKVSTEPVRSFAIGFGDDPSYDERSYARLVANHLGTRHTEFDVRADAVALMDRLLWHHDQPYGDSSAIPTYIVCELARSEVTVALNGDGGDEVFGGYDRFKAAAIAERAPRVATKLGRAGARLLPRNHGYYSLRRRLERFLELGELDPRRRYQSWIAVMNDELLTQLLPDGCGQNGAVLRSMDNCYAAAADLPLLDQILYANFKTYLPDDLAVKMDRMSMAHSLETRSPFLDTSLIELMAGVAASRKVGLRRVKPLLRSAFRPLLPDEIWNRRKHGFGVPLGAWFRDELRTMFEDEALAPEARIHDILDVAVVRVLWDEHQRGVRENGFRLWTLLTLEHWLRALERPPVAAPPAAELVRG